MAGMLLGIAKRSVGDHPGKKFSSKFWIFAFVQLALMISIIRPEVDGRYGGFVMSTILIFGFSEILLKGWSVSLKFPALFGLLIFPMGAMLNSPVDLLIKIPKNYLFQPAQKYVDQYHSYQESKNWMNENLPKDAVVVALADKANFYLDIKSEPFAEMKKWSDLAESSKSGLDFLKKVKAQGYRYFYLQTHFVYPPTLGPWWDELMKIGERTKMFKLQSMMLLDLEKL